MVIVDNTPILARRAIARLSTAGLDAVALLREVTDLLRPVIPFDCGSWLLDDPDAQVPIGAVSIDEAPSDELRLLYCVNEHLQDDVNKFRDLARQRVPAATMAEATGGRLRESPRFREILEPRGLAHELRVALVSDGALWGSLTLRRATRAPGFTPEDARFAASLSAPVAEGLSRAMLADPPASSRLDAPGVVLLDEQGAVAGATGAAEDWLRLLDRSRPPGRPPLAVASVAVQARARDRVARPGHTAGPARLHVRAASGLWLVLDAATCRDSAVPTGWVAVVVRPASPGDVLSLAARRYGLSSREQDVVRLVLQGLSTRQIGASLGISPLTVQDHLKAIFAKTGVSSRRELAFRLALPPA